MNGVTFVRPGGGFVPLMTYFEKIDVNGANEDPIFTWLKGSCPYTDDTYDDNIFYSPLVVGDINWNFEKFLVGKDGQVFTRYHPKTTDPADIMPDIDFLLAQPFSQPSKDVKKD